MKKFVFATALVAVFNFAFSQTKPSENTQKKWFEKISIRGYAQLRYNRLLETNPNLKCEQCDKSLGENGGFFLRRGRIVFSGDVSDRLYFYIQPDFASNVSSSFQHTFQIRDAYFDFALEKEKEFRIRFGQSKVPYGFENMQSSQNRLALDRNDALNSAVSNERDLGAFFYYAPKEIRKRFSYLVSSGLKGSGDYGVFGFGLYNGQTANKEELNNNLYKVARLTYPFEFSNGQFIETSLQAYVGKYTIATSTANKLPTNTFEDKRTAASLVVYPQPLGFQVEYNVGKGPEFDPLAMTTKVQNLKGGYVQAMYRIKNDKNEFIPFVKYQYYNGGKKFEIDARKYRVSDLEVGLEYQVKSYFELVALYMVSDRTFEDYSKPKNQQKGNTLRLQAQFNF